VVVAVMRDSLRARSILPHLIHHTSFGDASVPDMVAAAARPGIR
jgi:hypothetical protein